MLPAFFIAHGSPMLALEQNQYTMRVADLGAQMKPSGIVIFSAHWESGVQRVGAAEQYRTIHDFGGFSEALYRVQYPARGDAQLAAEVSRLLADAGISSQPDPERGLDHGAWVVLRMLYPNADVPVVAMSVNASLPPQEQYAIGKALSALRARDILIVGSGGTVHNFSTMRWQQGAGEADPWAVQFDDWVLDKAAKWDLEALFAYEQMAPGARLAVPPNGNEHFVPVFYAMGAADDQRVAKELHRHYEMGNLSHALWQFGE